MHMRERLRICPKGARMLREILARAGKRCGLISVIWEKEKTALKGGGRKMKKSIAFLVTAFLLLSCVAMAYAQPLEELVVDVVREEEAESGTSSSVIPNLNETMGVHGVAQGFVDAGGMLRGMAYLYEFESAGARVEASWRLDAALTKRGFVPSDFIFEGATYTLYSNSNGGVLVMDGVTEKTSMVVLAGDYYQEGDIRMPTTELTASVNGGEERQYVLESLTVDENGVTAVFHLLEPLGDGYDTVEISFPQAQELEQAVLTMVYAPQG